VISPVRFVAAAVGVGGAAVALASGALVVRGPFLGGPTLDPIPLLATLGTFVVGVAAAAWGLTRYGRG
jgi:hypothetical protein